MEVYSFILFNRLPSEPYSERVCKSVYLSFPLNFLFFSISELLINDLRLLSRDSLHVHNRLLLWLDDSIHRLLLHHWLLNIHELRLLLLRSSEHCLLHNRLLELHDSGWLWLHNERLQRLVDSIVISLHFLLLIILESCMFFILLSRFDLRARFRGWLTEGILQSKHDIDNDRNKQNNQRNQILLVDIIFKLCREHLEFLVESWIRCICVRSISQNSLLIRRNWEGPNQELWK